MMLNLWQAFSEDRRIRQEDEHLSLEGLNFNAYDVKPGKSIYDKGGVNVSVFEVDHGDHVKPAYGYKITYKGHSVVLSGDTRYSKNFENAARGADLLIHEVQMVPEAVLAKMPEFKAVYKHHITPELAGKLFSIARPKLVVYYHVGLVGVPGIAKEPTCEDLLAATRKTYDGKVLVGYDLMTIKISDSGVSVIKDLNK
jgi:ribonuclease Z